MPINMYEMPQTFMN